MNEDEFDDFIQRIRPHVLATEDVELELEFGTRIVQKPEGVRREMNGTVTAFIKVHGGAIDTGFNGIPLTPTRAERSRRRARRALEAIVGRLN